MNNKALVVIDLQNDITKHYRDIIDTVNEPGRVYELGYERCTCPKVLSGQITDPDQCNCSRQSILYILGRLEPNSSFEVEILETVLRGADYCRFRITKESNHPQVL